MDSEHLPPSDQPIWLLFDLSNGHKESGRYCWWFTSEEASIEFRKDYQKRKPHTLLSLPKRFSP